MADAPQRQLPARPNLQWLRKAAKDRLQDLRIESADAKLSDAQLSVAREFGFSSWRNLREHVESLTIDSQLVIAARNGDAARLAKLLDEYPDKLYVTGGRWDQPLLHHAAASGHLSCMKVLIDRGYDLDHRDKLDNATALHFAAESGKIDAIQFLVDLGADIHGEGDAHELGILGWATALHSCHPKAAEILMRHGAIPNIFAAVALGLGDRVRQIASDDRAELQRRGSRFENARTPLHLAVQHNLPAMVALLLELGADAKARDSRGRGPMGWVKASTAPEIPKILHSAGADLREREDNHFGSVTPILSVKNIDESIEYFVNKLGFKKLWEWDKPATFAAVGRNNVEIFLSQGGHGQLCTWMTIWVKNVDALYEEYQRTGAIIRQPPTNFPWGCREMNVEDVNGHRLRMTMEATGPADATRVAQ